MMASMVEKRSIQGPGRQVGYIWRAPQYVGCLVNPQYTLLVNAWIQVPFYPRAYIEILLPSWLGSGLPDGGGTRLGDMCKYH